MGVDAGGVFGEGDEVVVAVLDALQERAVALGEEVAVFREDGEDHGRVDGGELGFLSFGDLIGAVPLAGGVFVEEAFDGKIEGGDNCVRLRGGLDAAAGGDDGGDKLALFRAALEPAAGGVEFPIGGLYVVGAGGVVSIGEAGPAAGGDGDGHDEGGGIDGEGG